jgi:hypothetical protein
MSVVEVVVVVVLRDKQEQTLETKDSPKAARADGIGKLFLFISGIDVGSGGEGPDRTAFSSRPRLAT